MVYGGFTFFRNAADASRELIGAGNHGIQQLTFLRFHMDKGGDRTHPHHDSRERQDPLHR